MKDLEELPYMECKLLKRNSSYGVNKGRFWRGSPMVSRVLVDLGKGGDG